MAPTDDKRSRLTRLLQEKARKPKQAPLSFSQERMWFADQWSEGRGAFIMAVSVRLSGRLDVEALQSALRGLVQRHETLRTTFTVAEDGRPLQTILPSQEVSLPQVDLQPLAEGERERQAWQRLAAEAQRPFDLTYGPLLRSVLFRLSAREHLLLLNIHHLISDGWSQGVLIRELALLYQASTEGRGAPLAPLPLQYADDAVWQRERLQGKVLEEQLAWWRARLDPEAVLALPTDRPRPATLSPGEPARRCSSSPR